MAKWLNKEALNVLLDYYYPRAKFLQVNCNWGKLSYTSQMATVAVQDPLMQNIEIYDCYTRNAAGFSNVLQDLWYREKTPKWHHQSEQRHDIIRTYETETWNDKDWMYAMLCHRIMGSGASFEEDHGYRNNCVQHWGELRDYGEMANDLLLRKKQGQALFTSIGNQPPAPRKGVSNVEFMVKELPGLVDRLLEWLNQGERKSCKAIVDFLNEYNLEAGHRRFNFAYAAFSYDLGDYFPNYVDPQSHGYFGNNAIRCMKSMSKGYTTDEFMDILVERTGGAPRDLEDVLCDGVRFFQQYDPWKRGLYYNASGFDSLEAGYEDRSGKNDKKPVNLTEFFL